MSKRKYSDVELYKFKSKTHIDNAVEFEIEKDEGRKTPQYKLTVEIESVINGCIRKISYIMPLDINLTKTNRYKFRNNFFEKDY